MYGYTWYQWLLIFYCYCVCGWIFESTYVSFKSRRFVNRGFLRLPMLPLYGTGAVMMLFVSIPVKDNLVLVYIAGVIGATVLEYVTGWGMEKLFKMRYWDYSNQRFQINGYICLSSSIAWGFLTIFLTEVIHRPVERMILGIHPAAALVLTAGISVVFVADVIESTRAALDLGRALEAMTRMKAEMEEMQVQLALLRSELKDQTARRLAAAQEENAQRMAEIRAGAAARMNGLQGIRGAGAAESTAARVAELRAEVAGRLEKLDELKENAAEKLDELKDSAAERLVKLDELKENAAEKLDGLKDSAAERLEKLDELKESVAEKLDELKDSAAERLGGLRRDSEARLRDEFGFSMAEPSEMYQETAAHIEALLERMEALRKRRGELREQVPAYRRFYLRGIVRGNPTAVSRKYKDALRELQQELQKNREEKRRTRQEKDL
ncbi:MAG: hypothetical protein Q4F29_07255 [Lachnospiraceae bacterium]|nr:hypothetical protein [Lachnospiraceae bacterium]